MKRRKILSLLLAFLMVLSVLPALTAVKAKAETMPAEIKAMMDGLRGTKDYKLTLDKDYSYTDSGATSMGNGAYAWAIVHGNNVIDLNGHKLTIKVESITDVSMLWVEMGASLTILDSSAKKNGEILFDAKIDDDNTYRKRTVIRNEGTLTIYGGAFTAGHYDSYYSAYYAKTIYKMTTGVAVDNHNAAYIYGGTFTGRNHFGSAIRVSGGYTCVYDAKLIGKGGAKGFDTYSTGSNLRVFAAYIDLYKENAVKNDGAVTKGYDYGTSGITPGYLAEGHQIKEQKYTDRSSSQKNNLWYATLLDIRPGDSKPELTFSTGDKTMNVDAEPGKGLETRFYFSPTYTLPHDLKNADGSYISNIYFHVKLQKKASGQWVTVTEKNSTRHQTYFTLKDLYSGYENNVDYRILVSASLDYQGYNRTLSCINNSEVIIYVNVSVKKVITETGATIAIPTAGSKPSYTISSNAPADYTATITGWYKGSTPMTATDSFVSGQEYYASVKFTATANTKIADNAVFKVNGTVCKQYSENGTIVAHWPVTVATTVKELGAVTIEDFTYPISGMTPGQVFDFNFTDTTTFGTYIQDYIWYERTVEGNLEALGKNDTFTKGKDYCIRILLGAANGYQFKSNTQFSINGYDSQVVASKTAITPQWASIYSIDYTADYLQTMIRFDGNGATNVDHPGYKYVRFGESIGSSALWYLPDNYDYERDGYILDGWYTEKTGGEKINDTDISKFISDVTLYAHWRLPTVSQINIDGIQIPVAGQTVRENIKNIAVPKNAAYSVNRVKWAKITGSGQETELKDTDTFTADDPYYIAFKVLPAEGYQFADKVTILLNGSEQLVYTDLINIHPDGFWFYTVNIFCEPTKYAIKVTDGKANTSSAEQHTEITLTANAPASGKVFDKWVVVSGGAKLADVTKATTTFEMPAANVEIKATYKDAPTEPEKPTFTYGDVDRNGKIEAADARLALRGSVGLTDKDIDFTKTTSVNFLAADVDANGKLEAGDARLILRFSVGLESKLGK